MDDGQTGGQERLKLPQRWGWGGEQDCQLQELDGRTQDPSPTHQTHPDPSGSLGCLTFRAPHICVHEPFWLIPTFHSPSFLTLRMTPLKISVGEGGLRMLGPLPPTHTLKPSGFQAGLPS